MPEVIDEKIIPSSLTVERGRFRKKPVPVEFEVRHREAAEPTLPEQSPVILGIIGQVAISPDSVRYTMDVRKEGLHRDLRLAQNSVERIVGSKKSVTGSKENTIVNIITRGVSAQSIDSVVRAWYDKDHLNTRSVEAQIVPEVLAIGCYVLRDVMRTVRITGQLPNEVPLTNDDILSLEAAKRPAIYVEGAPAYSFNKIVEQAYL